MDRKNSTLNHDQHDAARANPGLPAVSGTNFRTSPALHPGANANLSANFASTMAFVSTLT
jgi:hypothetical protein